jgi:lysophospholipase L1-like esterase
MTDNPKDMSTCLRALRRDLRKRRAIGGVAGALLWSAAGLVACSSSPPDSPPTAGGSGGQSGASSGGAGQATGGAPVGQPGGAGGSAGGVDVGAGGAVAGGAGSAASSGGGSPMAGSAGQGAGGSSGAGGSTVRDAGRDAPAVPAEAAAAVPGTTVGEVPLDPALLSKCTGTAPIVCAFTAPNGNYNVTVELGDAAVATTAFVYAETRRIVVPSTTVAAGSSLRSTFSVNVRAETHDGGQSAPGGILNLVIGGSAPHLRGVGIAAASMPTIFVAGDSTVCDWDPGNTSSLAPDEAGWAQELSQYLKPGVAVANYADSGETAGSFLSKFYPPMKALMKSGDYLFVQFAHNDQKAPAGYVANLQRFVTDAKAANVTPVLITSVSRRTSPDFAGLDQMMRDLAASQSVALIDLTKVSWAYYATLPDSKVLFADSGTHFVETGATQIARLFADALKTSALPLKAFVK